MDLPILDDDRIKLITLGRSALANEFLAALIGEAGGLIERLGKPLSGDRTTVSDIAHTIKGMATELGAMRLRAAAASLETETHPARWPDLIQNIRGALTDLQSLRR